MYDTRRPHAQIMISYPFPQDSPPQVHASNMEKPLPPPIESSPLSAPSLWSPQEPSSSSGFSPMDKSRFSISPTSPAMPSKIRLHSKKPSLQNTMSWLTRTTSSASSSSHSMTVPYAKAARPMRISEPQFLDAGSTSSAGRCGILGSGAHVVRTPQEALEGSQVSVDPRPQSLAGLPVEPINEVEENMLPDGDDPATREEPEDSASEYEEDEREEAEDQTYRLNQLLDTQRHSGGSSEGHRVPPAYSPPRSSLSLSKSTPCLVTKNIPPSRPCPPPPPDVKITPLKLKHYSPLPFTPGLQTPSMPAHLANPAPQPPFDCIQLADISPKPVRGSIDPSRVIVTVDTTSDSHRTTLATLTSRPSHLGAHLLALLTHPVESRMHKDDADERSRYDDDESFGMRYDDNDEYSDSEGVQDLPSIFKQHLAASGLLPSSPVASVRPAPVTRMHIFLDRPSEPYEHVLAYLRSPDQPAILPTTLHLLPYTAAATASLVAVRDEAAYLGLADLSALCTTELRARYAPPAPSLPRPAHSRGPSAGSLHTFHARDSFASAGSSASTSASVEAGAGMGIGMPIHKRQMSRDRDGVVVPPVPSIPSQPTIIPPDHGHERSQSHSTPHDAPKTLRVRRAVAWV
ncbi:hypothetical protein K488DRAFT_81759 [Vararia minispora EC-137]|uniref:Uncharacterized protein n=1 Tax=Vararia minispora EC-137 TaxID=1314806 RepID=A0ACB8QY37_9AGAM|nr:hypothetical protein K488DRAFT_81759 [Vararia minispora EC-137]